MTVLNLKIDAIIPTFNRLERVTKTIHSLLAIDSSLISKVYVVDSSDQYSVRDFPQNPRVVVLKSSHKNQPYQRYLGSLASTANVLLLLDDDMDVIDEACLESNLELFQDDNVVGLNIGYQYNNAFFEKIPRHVVSRLSGTFFNRIKALSGFPDIEDNQFWLCGLRGKRKEGASIEYVFGSVFAARRDVLYENFNFNLFDLYEKKLGKGEDVILGYSLSRHGTILAGPGECFFHDDQKDSTYTIDLRSFYARKSFSRLYLSLEYVRLKGISTTLAYLHYHWYMLWRAASMLLTCLFRFSPAQLNSLKGWLTGWRVAFTYRLRPIEERRSYWISEAERDVEKNRFTGL